MASNRNIGNLSKQGFKESENESNSDWKKIILYIEQHQDIEILDLSNNHLMSVPNKFLIALAKHPNIKTVNLDNNHTIKRYVTDTEYDNRGRAIETPDVYKREDMPEYEKAKVRDIVKVRKDWGGPGNFRERGKKDEDWDEIIQDLQKHQGIEYLNLSGNHFRRVPDRFLKAIANHPNIKRVNLDDNSLSTYIKGYTDRGPRDTDIEIPGRWETSKMPNSEKEKVSDIAKVKKEWGVGNLRGQGLSDENWSIVLEILNGNPQLTTLNLTKNKFNYVPHDVIKAINEHQNLLAVAIDEGATKSQIDKVINKKIAIRNLEKALEMVDSVLEGLKDKNLDKIQLNELFRKAQSIISAVNNKEVSQHTEVTKFKARKEFKALEQMHDLVTNIKSTDVEALEKAFAGCKNLMELSDNVVAKENICKTILFALEDGNISIPQIIFLGRTSKLLNIESFNESRDKLIFNAVTTICERCTNDVEKGMHDQVAELLPSLYATLELLIENGELNASKELFNSLDQLNKALFDQNITADVYKKAIAAIKKAEIAPDKTITKYNKMYMVRSINRNGRLQGGTLYEHEKIELLRKLEKTFMQKEIEDPEYQSIKITCNVRFLRAMVERYVGQRHAPVNKTRAEKFLENTEGLDKDIDKMYWEMLDILSSTHQKLKELVIESLEIVAGINFAKNQKKQEQWISEAREYIMSELSKKGLVALTINKKLKIEKITKADKIFEQWQGLAEYVAKLTYDRDFSATGKIRLLSTDDDPRSAISKAKSLSDLYTAVETLKVTCTSLVGDNSIASVLTTISNGIDKLQIPNPDEIVLIRKTLKTRETRQILFERINNKLAALNEKYRRDHDPLKSEINKILGLLKEEGYESAQQACLKLIQKNPHSSKLLWLSGMLYREAHEDNNAFEQFKKVIKNSKDNFGEEEAFQELAPSAPPAQPDEIEESYALPQPVYFYKGMDSPLQEICPSAPHAQPEDIEENDSVSPQLQNLYPSLESYAPLQQVLKESLVKPSASIQPAVVEPVQQPATVQPRSIIQEEVNIKKQPDAPTPVPTNKLESEVQTEMQRDAARTQVSEPETKATVVKQVDDSSKQPQVYENSKDVLFAKLLAQAPKAPTHDPANELEPAEKSATAQTQKTKTLGKAT